MAKHTIEIEGLREYELKHIIAESLGKVSKSLRASVKNGCVTYEVLDHRKVVSIHQDIVRAAEAYNEI